MKQVYKNKIHFLGGLIALVAILATGCRKTDFPDVSSPAYLRVFNCLTYNVTIDNKDAPPPFLTMLIDPVLDASGIPVSADLTFDFMATRGPLARPYPDAGNTALWQKEFPGTAKIPVGPIVNGYDLSGYGMVKSGTHRFMFVSRPRSNDPFYSLPVSARKGILVDTTINLEQGEIYTMNILEKSVYTRKIGLYLRKEIFTKIPLSDSLVYTNFYNLSSEGYAQTFVFDDNSKNTCIRDTMNIFYSLYGKDRQKIKGYTNAFMTGMTRSQDPAVRPYGQFPLFPDSTASHIYAGTSGQMFNILSPGTPPDQGEQSDDSKGNYTSFALGPEAPIAVFNLGGDVRTGMVISVYSGIYNPRSFATVNTVEYVNGNMYITTLQRRYDPPVYK
ncbi:hypothetical protein [Chitinophaga varians]|uniref:hypothetical protein n=1 Tax=Chitinophaga varians TaxID=2202339 RepID=UPI00165F1766|nr:hypothetical protein [Chitinophaga varians]MBC9913019.1 hypothetical protein [Chitinophaga varians]